MAPAHRIHLIPNGVDLRRFAPAERRANQGRILYIGRLSEEKNLSALVKAAAALQARVPNRLVMIGAGPLRDTLEAEARAAGVPAEFPGVVDHQLIPRWLRDADAFVLPSFTEGHPKALIEAMAAGVPSVVSDCAGNRALVKDAAAGLLFDPQSPADLAAALERVLTDDALASALSRRGRDVVSRDYDLGRLVQTEIDLLERVARGANA
jgi:glycosyltransferase involved in cell wall biosynthesis